MTTKAGVAIVGSGNIGTDLMIKILRHSEKLRMVAMVGIDPNSDGLARAARMGVATTAEGVAGLLELPEFADVDIICDATSAAAHIANAELLAPYGRRLVDLTPAAIGPFVIPAVNFEEHLDASDMYTALLARFRRPADGPPNGRRGPAPAGARTPAREGDRP